jgi:hypothetical protein
MKVTSSLFFLFFGSLLWRSFICKLYLDLLLNKSLFWSNYYIHVYDFVLWVFGLCKALSMLYLWGEKTANARAVSEI